MLKSIHQKLIVVFLLFFSTCSFSQDIETVELISLNSSASFLEKYINPASGNYSMDLTNYSMTLTTYRGFTKIEKTVADIGTSKIYSIHSILNYQKGMSTNYFGLTFTCADSIEYRFEVNAEGKYRFGTMVFKTYTELASGQTECAIKDNRNKFFIDIVKNKGIQIRCKDKTILSLDRPFPYNPQKMGIISEDKLTIEAMSLNLYTHSDK